MEQLVFLDTNLVYNLSFIKALKDKYGSEDKDVSNILLYEEYRDTDDKKKCAMTGNPKAVERLIELYYDIEAGNVKPCICPVVCSEIMNDNSGKLRDADKNPFTKMMQEYINENCTIYMPSKEFKDDFISHTYDLQGKLKKNQIKMGSVWYGLNDEKDKYGQPHKDFNDRAMLAQLAVFSQYSNEKINVVDFKNIDKNTKKYINEIHGKLTNKKSNTVYKMFKPTKCIKLYHFNQQDMGTRAEDESLSRKGHKKAKILEGYEEKQLRESNKIDQSSDQNKDEELQINIQHIAEYEK